MFEIWLSGAIASYFLSAYQYIKSYVVLSHNPWRSNLAKIDLLWDLNLNPVDEEYKIGWSLFWWLSFGVPINSLLLSWIQVALSVVSILTGKLQSKMYVNVPKDLQDLDWKIRNTNLSQEDAISTMRELATKLGDTARLSYLDQFERGLRDTKSA